MTVLNSEALTTFLDLIESGESANSASVMIGLAPRSKSIFGWLKASRAAQADVFEAPPDASSLWAITRGEGDPQWFHDAYRLAVASRRTAPRPKRAAAPSAALTPLQVDLAERMAAKRDGRAPAVRPSLAERNPAPPLAATPLRVELEERLKAKREEQAGLPSGPRLVVDHYRSEPVRVVAPPPRPTDYARRSPPLDNTNTEPPQEGRFTMQTQTISRQTARAGSVEITNLGIRRW